MLVRLFDSGMGERRKMQRRRNVLLSLVFVVALLVPGGVVAQSANKHVNPAGLSKPNGYSHVVIAQPGTTIYLSGQVALDDKGNVIGVGDMKAQTKQVFENLKTALGAAGASFADVVKITFYVTDVTQIQKIREVRDQYVQAEPPASTLVEVKALVRLEFMIEVDAVAVVPTKDSPQRK
jgi:reactive intermediate/imine deaminase